MALPTQKRTKASKRRRASHFALKSAILIKCPKCGKMKKPHHACQFCGDYRGRAALTIKPLKKSARQREKERKQKERDKESKK